jgi:hypothetical protein
MRPDMAANAPGVAAAERALCPNCSLTSALEPYLIAGVGTYVEFIEERFGLNGGAGVRQRAGPLRLFVEVRYHRVTRRFDEAHKADTFVPLSLGG